MKDWFIDIDTGDSLTFEVTRSDGTAKPTWMQIYEGQIVGFPEPGSNEIIHIKIAATDTNRGWNYLLRSFLVNSAP